MPAWMDISRSPSVRICSLRLSRSRYRTFAASAPEFDRPDTTPAGTTVLGFWVTPIVNGHQLRQRHLRVFLCRRQSRVPEQFLNGSQVGAVVQQVCCVGMPEAVGM